jgi:hypothetical protein
VTALRTWVATRVGVALIVLAGSAQVFGDRSQGFLDRWDSWDVTLFSKVAQFGYTGYPQHYPDQDIAAFFPGFPLVLRAAHTVIPNWTAAGLLVSFVAGAIGVVYLAKLADLDGSDGSKAVLFLSLSPYALFLFAGYSEALFLAFALPGWFAARKGNWAAASLLVAGATTVRISGLFLAIGLLVEFLTTSRDWKVAPWLAAPFLSLLGYVVYLHHISGDWLRWQHAQADGWGRHLTNPVTALRSTWHAANSSAIGTEYQWSFHAEIAAVFLGLLVTGVLLARRSWGEAAYVGLSVAALATSTYYLSVARATLLWFPVWILLAELAAKRPWVQTAYLATAPALMAVAVLTFTNSRWVG